jgi:Plavaka transposase
MGEFLYKKVEMSAGDVDELMDIWAIKDDDLAPFSPHEHMYATIDEIKHGDAPWKSFTISYAGHLGPDPPSWQLQDYQVWCRDPDIVAMNMLDNPDFDGEFDYGPYVEVDKSGQRRWNEPMSGNFAWRHAVHFILFLFVY